MIWRNTFNAEYYKPQEFIASCLNRIKAGRVGIVKIRAIHVHDSMDSTHGALHHGCYLCVWK